MCQLSLAADALISLSSLALSWSVCALRAAVLCAATDVNELQAEVSRLQAEVRRLKSEAQQGKGSVLVSSKASDSQWDLGKDGQQSEHYHSLRCQQSPPHCFLHTASATLLTARACMTPVALQTRPH